MTKRRSIIGIIIWIFLVNISAGARTVISADDVRRTREYVINWYNSGEYYEYGHCQGFVNQCWQRSLGGNWYSTCCAKKGWDKFGVSSSSEDIPIGASVYFTNNSGKRCSGCGQYPGHVGFYIGNGEIIHVYNKVKDDNGNSVKMKDGSTAGYIRRTTIQFVINDGYTYLGWGWHSNKELERVALHNHAYKGADEHCIKCGEAYKPKVESMNNQKSNVIVAETSLKARPYQDSETISKVKRGTEVTLVNSYINAYGNLWYEVRCNGKSGYMYNDKVGSASSLSINMTDWPSSIKVGSGYGLRGTIKSNYSITKVEGYVQNSSGSNVLTSVDNPNSTSMNVRNANLNNKLAFNKLGEGDYRLIIKAHDNSGKVVTASKNFNVCREQQKAASSLSINLERYPVSLNQGSSFGLRGSVDSNYNISEVRGYVTDSAGNTVLSSRDYPNSTSMNIRYADLNNSLVFNRLGAGDYTMKVVAYDSSGRQAVATKNFSVYGGSSNNNSGAVSSLSINMTSYPSSINQGSGFGLRGSIDSNYNITKVSGYVLDSSGNVVLSSTDYPNSTSMNVRYANLNNDLVFNRLGSGNYTLKVVASDGVTSREWSSGFSVSGGQVSQGNVRTGIINIPSSWDNLSIRSGPGTGYQIVGSMNQGVSCTVYTDKTRNGWYYVNYNGVTGYASGRQINLQ